MEVMFLAYGDLFTDLYVAFELGGTQSVMGRVTFAIIGVSWLCQGRSHCFVLTMYIPSPIYLNLLV